MKPTVSLTSTRGTVSGAKARDLDLRARSAGARVPVKDFQDHHGAVHHLAADLLLQVERLRGGDLVIDENRIGGVFFPQQAQLLPLAGAEVRRLVEPGAL